MNKTKTSVKDTIIAALLTALAFILPMIMPSFTLEPIFSATLASHVPGILAMFVSPFAVIGTALGSALVFFIKLGPWVAARAFFHLIFGLLGYSMYKKKYNIFLILALTALTHAVSEVFVGFFSALVVGVPAGGIVKGILVTIGLGTLIHHVMDFVISLIILNALQSTKLLGGEVNFETFKD